jgi:hypothetical protein
VSPARRLIEDRIARLSDDLDVLFTESRDRARREQAEQLNQAVRRLRIASDPDELCGTLEHAASQFAESALLFRVESGEARHERITIPMDSAAAFADAVQSREPVTAAAIPSQMGTELVEMAGESAGGRVSIFPIDAAGEVRALLCCWGNPQTGALELLAQFTGVTWTEPEPLTESEPESEPEPSAAPELISIAPAAAAAPAPAKPAASWESLPVAEQQAHLRAQRFARVQIAEMRLYEADAVQRGRSRGNLYGALRDRIDAARRGFREQFFSSCPSMVDYLHLELLRTLANDDPDLFGKDYPGPLV